MTRSLKAKVLRTLSHRRQGGATVDDGVPYQFRSDARKGACRWTSGGKWPWSCR